MLGLVPVPENDCSATPTLLRVVPPVFVTWSVYVTDWPAADTCVGETLFASEMPGVAATAKVAVESLVTVEPAAVPEARAELSTTPASMSACVTV
jgi:hypothetical protein